MTESYWISTASRWIFTESCWLFLIILNLNWIMTNLYWIMINLYLIILNHAESLLNYSFSFLTRPTWQEWFGQSSVMFCACSFGEMVHPVRICKLLLLKCVSHSVIPCPSVFLHAFCPLCLTLIHALISLVSHYLFSCTHICLSFHLTPSTLAPCHWVVDVWNLYRTKIF